VVELPERPGGQAVASTRFKPVSGLARGALTLATCMLVLMGCCAQAAAAAPTVTGVSPPAGPIAGGTSVTITGAGFVSGATVAFGTGHAATNVTVNSGTSITAASPAESTGTVDITVTTPGGTSTKNTADRFTFDPVPSVTAISTSAGPIAGGTTVTITGANFITGATTVAFGIGAGTNVTVKSATSITATSIAESTGTVDITVTTPGGTSTTNTADQFTFDPVPTVTAISPSAGPTAGGTTVTITGTGFVSSASVVFGTGHAATNITVYSATLLTATSPAESTGTVDITVTTPGGASTTSAADKFSYDPIPTVTAISTNAGPTTGGTKVTITGTHFITGVTTVAFGTGAATDVTVTSTTSITATSPAANAGTFDIAVTTPGGTSATGAADKFAVDPLPIVEAVSPSGGPLDGGTAVTITGTGFISGGTSVNFGSGYAATSITVKSATSITATSPAESAGTIDITVTTPGGTSTTTTADEFTFDAVPTLTAVSPNAGPIAGGTTVTITGTGFVSGRTSVSFGSGHGAADVTVNSPTSITTSPPAESTGTVDVTVGTPGGTSAPSTADRFTYDPVSTVTAISASAGPTAGGTTVTITGTNFISGATTVAFGAEPATNVTVNSPGSVTGTSPAATAGTADITVTTPGGTSATNAADKFTFDPPATVTAVSPSGGPLNGGTIVTITGTGFVSGNTSVNFGSGHAATKITFNSTASITATSPAETAGTIDITVTTPNGTSTTSSADEFTYDPVPAVTAVTPGAGNFHGGIKVTITGTDFVAGSTSVNFGARHAATSITVNSPSSITTSPPAESTGTVDVTVTTPGGTSFTSAADEFTYSAAPTVTAISPRGGTAAGGTSVTITGTNFSAGATTVAFGTGAATNVTVSATSITATSPAATDAGPIDITVTTPGGTSTTSPADMFTYTPTPTVTAVRPNAGAPTGGTKVTIHGSHLGGATAVWFGSKPAASFKDLSGSEITAVSPPRRAGSIDVTVTTPLGTSPITPAAGFKYATAPLATREPATDLTPTRALLRATVDPHGLPVTTCQFEYGRTTHYGRRITCSQSIAATASAVTVSAVVTGLVPATTYHFRLLTGTQVGTSRGEDEQFTTQQLPIVAPPQVGLLVQSLTNHPGFIGRLLGISGIIGATPGETITVICQRGCAPHLLRTIPVRSRATARGRTLLTHPLLLTATTQIQIDVSATGKLSRYTRYAFSLAGSSVAVRVTQTGCLAATGHTVGCRAPTERRGRVQAPAGTPRITSSAS
jgi:hypothetical protein